MKILVVLASIVAVTFGAAIIDKSLKDDFEELSSLYPQEEITELVTYYLENDAEFKNLITSDDWTLASQIMMQQPEVREFAEWISKNLIMSGPGNKQIGQLALRIHDNYKPGWKGFMDAYIALIPSEEIANFIREKVSQGGIFAEFWGKVQGLRPAYERVIRLPEFVAVVQRLEALGFDADQYDSLVREQLGWN